MGVFGPCSVMQYLVSSSCANPESFVTWGPNLTFLGFFKLMRGEGIFKNTTISWLSSARQRNAI